MGYTLAYLSGGGLRPEFLGLESGKTEVFEGAVRENRCHIIIAGWGVGKSGEVHLRSAAARLGVKVVLMREFNTRQGRTAYRVYQTEGHPRG